jgi:hypothetical protein
MRHLTKISNNNVVIDNDEFLSFETQSDFKLPSHIKEFIKNYQGSKVKEILFYDKKMELWVINAFFLFSEAVKLFLEFLNSYQRRMLPFAYDPGGWHFCICLEKKDFGAIYVNRWTDHLPNEQFVKIAESLIEFVQGLQKEN